MNWKERLKLGEGDDMSAEGMAATRILRGLGYKSPDLWRLAREMDIPYDEDSSRFSTAVAIFRSMCPATVFISTMDVKCGMKRNALLDDMDGSTASAVVFYREGESMTSFLRVVGLETGALATRLIKPGISYVRQYENGAQIWEMPPEQLVRNMMPKEG